MFDVVVKSIIFLILLALGGYFFVLFQRRGWFFIQKGDGKGSNLDCLCVTGRLSMGGRHYIAVVQCNGQKFLVGISPSTVTSLGELRPFSPNGKSSVRSEEEGDVSLNGPELKIKRSDFSVQQVVPSQRDYSS